MDTDPEILAAARAAEAEAPHLHARRWMLENQVGTLCTTLARRGLAGFPYGSVVPFALDGRGRPFILIAGIATHTANLREDPRGSLFVRQPDTGDDPQAGWRITYIGTWAKVSRDDPEWDALHARYVERVPSAESYRATHDFAYWRMETVESVRYIGGFGKITWLKGTDCLRDPLGAGLEEAAPSAIEHMNTDHPHNLVEMVAGRYGTTVGSARMVSLERGGFLVQTAEPAGLYHFSFPAEIDADSLRQAVIGVLRDARGRAAS